MRGERSWSGDGQATMTTMGVAAEMLNVTVTVHDLCCGKLKEHDNNKLEAFRKSWQRCMLAPVSTTYRLQPPPAWYRAR